MISDLANDELKKTDNALAHRWRSCAFPDTEKWAGAWTAKTSARKNSKKEGEDFRTRLDETRACLTLEDT
jgi:hypothetical protein